jgi:protein-tyrosine phosphatase
MAEQKRILFVCMGNIVRSPLAENIFLHQVAESGLANQFSADSAGMIDYHVGEHPDPRMREVARRHGLRYDGQARQFERGDFDRFDLILAMDQENLSDLKRLARTPEQRVKLHLLREFDPQGGPEYEVPDPYYGDIGGFEYVYEIVERSVEGLLDKLKNGWFQKQ